MKKRFSLLASVVALSAITLMGCSNGFHTHATTTAVSGKKYSGFYSGTTYVFSFASDTDSVLVTKDSSISPGWYSLSNTTLKVRTSEDTMSMEYDPGSDSLTYKTAKFYKN